jgi:hypothetical protein
MADDEARHRHLLRRPLHRQAVEAEATNPVLFTEAARERICRRNAGDRRVERGVEHGDVRDTRQNAASLANRRERRPVVQRRELGQR